MGFVTRITENNCLIATWNLNESLDELSALYRKVDFPKFRTEKRKKEFLAVRLLLEKIRPNSTIIYNKYGAPEIGSGNYISVSHSKNLVAIVISNKKVGLDVEFISEKTRRLSSKFLDKEVYDDLSEEKATLIWCCKEAIFKLYQKGDIDFKNDIILEPFILQDFGKINVIFKKKKHNLYYKKLDDYFLAYVSE